VFGGFIVCEPIAAIILDCTADSSALSQISKLMRRSIMKKFTLAFVGWVMILVAGVALTYAQESSDNFVFEQDGAMKAQAGKVVAIDTAKNELAVKDEKGAEKVMAVSPDTKILKEGKEIALADVKAGDRVIYELDGASDPPVAKSLTIMSAKPAKP
jgi:hypothetical protein